MNINTGRTHSEPDDAQSVVIPPDKGRPARKKTAQKPQRGRHVAGLLLSALRLLGYGAAVALAIMASFYVYRYADASDILGARNIEIEGCKHLHPVDLEKIIRQKIPSNILRIDLGMLRGGLVVIALVWLGGLTDLPQKPFWRNALSSKPLQQAALYAKDYMPENAAKK